MVPAACGRPIMQQKALFCGGNAVAAGTAPGGVDPPHYLVRGEPGARVRPRLAVPAERIARILAATWPSPQISGKSCLPVQTGMVPGCGPVTGHAECVSFSSIIMTSELAGVAARLREARRVLVLTGAGISAESGIPTFRSRGGWWRSLDPEQLATLRAFNADPETVWQWYQERRAVVAAAEPNFAHIALTEWEKRGKEVVVVTQNVDDLHERAGSSDVVHVHGSLWETVCLAEGLVREDRRVPLPELPPRCTVCGGRLRPNVVWFDEELPVAAVARIEHELSRGDFQIAFVVGTSVSFDYIQDWAMRARAMGALLVEVNPSATPLTPDVDVHLSGDAAGVLAALTAEAFSSTEDS
jgi:NAD-dependent deacetylase